MCGAQILTPKTTTYTCFYQHICVRINKYYFDCVSVHFVVFPKISIWKNINWRPDHFCSLEHLCYGICLCLVILTVRIPDDAAKQHSQSKECKNSHNSIKVFVVAQVWVGAQFTFACVYNKQSVLCACRCYDTACANGTIDCYEKYFNAMTQQPMISLAIPMFARMPMQWVFNAFFLFSPICFDSYRTRSRIYDLSLKHFFISMKTYMFLFLSENPN